MKGPTTPNKGLLVKTFRIAAASVAVVGLVMVAVPAQAAQPQATGKQQLVAGVLYKQLAKSYASDPNGLEDLCDLFAINATSTTALFMSDSSDWKALSKQLGVSMKDIRVGLRIAIKKACA